MSYGQSQRVSYSPDVKRKAAALLELRRRGGGGQSSAALSLESAGPAAWLAALFAPAVAAGSSPRHDALWAWAWAMRSGERSRPFVGCWPRGGGKSTTAELIAVAWGARATRRYVLYVCETQEQADDHVQNIAALLESADYGRLYPQMGQRLVGKFGNSKGWRRNRLRTASGFTVDALGLDTAARGIKLEDQRPDAMIIDDIDGENDSEAVVDRKHRTLTRKLLPAGATDCAHLFVENKVHDDSLMAQSLDGRADFFGDRLVSGPFNAIDDLEIVGDGAEARIVGGVATWAGQDIATCQAYITKWGLDAFLSECQHEAVAQRGRYLASIGLWDACQEPLPSLDAYTPIVLGIDAGESSDTFAIVGVSRHPSDAQRLAVRFSRVYVPATRTLDFDAIEQDIIGLTKAYAVREIAYDRFLLGQTVRRIAGRVPCPMEPFNQGNDRLEADKSLRDTIDARRLAHDGTHAELRAHLDNANAKASADGRQVRIVKRSHAKKIDAAVTLSMACARAVVVLQRVRREPVGSYSGRSW